MQFPKGFPHSWDGNGDLYNKESYLEMLNQKKIKEINFEDLAGPLKDIVIGDQLTMEFELWTSLKHIIKNLLHISYENFYLVLDSTRNHKYSSCDEWHQNSNNHKFSILH